MEMQVETDNVKNESRQGEENLNGITEETPLISNLQKDLENQPLKSFSSNNQEEVAQLKAEILALKAELELVKKERDELKAQLGQTNGSKHKITYEPVSNPLQTALVNYLTNVEVIKCPDIEEVMRSIDRGDFAPKDAYIDAPQLIGFNTTISAPHMHALQLELLKDCFKGTKKALDIGTGSGFMALAIAKMMRSEDIKVYGIDHIPKLIEQAKENVAKHHQEYLENDRIEFLIADGREGLAQYAPYDIILVGGAVKEIPNEFIEQLALGGSMLIPVGEFMQKLMVVHKTKEGKIFKNPVMSVGFGKLQSVEDQCPDIDE